MIRFKHIALGSFIIAALTASSLCWAQDLPFSEAIEANGVIYLSGHLDPLGGLGVDRSHLVRRYDGPHDPASTRIRRPSIGRQRR